MTTKGKRAAVAAQQEPSAQIPAFRPVKPRVHGRTKSVVSEAIEQAGGAKDVSDFLQRGLSTVYGYADDDVDGYSLSYDQARRLTRYRGVTAFAEDMAALAGGVFLPLDGGEPALIAKLGAIAQKQGGDFYAALIRAIDDGVISARERGELLHLVGPLIRTLVAAQSNLMVGGAANGAE